MTQEPVHPPRAVRVNRDTELRNRSPLTAACLMAGVTQQLVDLVVEGTIASLRCEVYRRLDDLFDGRDDVEQVVGWFGKPGAMLNALKAGGFVRGCGPKLAAVDAYQEAPAYIKLRWRRANRAGYLAASKRAVSPEVPL